MPINTKFPLDHMGRQKLLQRDRIDLFFNKGKQASVLLVTAGSGYGKTLAAAMYLNNTQKRAIWIQLTSLDNYPAHFWDTLTQSVTQVNPLLGQFMKNLGFPYRLKDFDLFTHEVAKHVYNGDHVYFVLDDFHLMTEGSILDITTKMMTCMPDNMTLVFLSSQHIHLGISSVFNKNQIQILTEQDLVFTEEEIRQLLDCYDIIHTPSLAEKIMTYTEGWPLAVSLIVFSIKRGNILEDEILTDIMPFVLQLIEKEFFSHYTPSVQKLLVKLSLLDDIHVECLKEFTSSTEELEELLEILSSNIFIHYNRYMGISHFHYLFQKYLVSKQDMLTKEEIHTCYLIIGTWYQNHNLKISAIQYFDKCGRTDKILECILTEKSFHFSRQDTEFFLHYINKFPDSFVEENPYVYLLQASLHINNLKITETFHDLHTLLHLLKKREQTEETLRLTGEAHAFLGLASIFTMSEACLDHFQRADALLPTGSRFLQNYVNLWDGYNVTHLSDGTTPVSLDKTVQLFFRTMPYAVRVLSGKGYGAKHLAAAEVYFHRHELNHAKKCCYQAIYRAKEKQQLDVFCSASFLLIRIYMANGSFEELESIHRSINELSKTYEGYQTLALPDMIASWFYLHIDHPEKVPSYLLDSEQYFQKTPPITINRGCLVRASWLLKNGRYREVIAYAEEVERFLQRLRIDYVTVYCSLLRTIAYYYLGEKEECCKCFYEAYSASYKENLHMMFVEFGTEMITIIEYVKSAGLFSMDEKWLDRIILRASAYAKRRSYIIKEYNAVYYPISPEEFGLTEREKNILRQLCQGLTREEISKNYHLSANTLNGSIQSIYTKLGTVNLADTVRVAISQNLI